MNAMDALKERRENTHKIIIENDGISKYEVIAKIAEINGVSIKKAQEYLQFEVSLNKAEIKGGFVYAKL